jgi:hypothetical protein
MAGNHLENLVAEWFEFQGFFVRKNIQVDPRPNGGYNCELDVVAFNPANGRLVHIEPSLDAYNWKKREARYRRKFEAGRKFIPNLFPRLELPDIPEQIALMVYGSKGDRTHLGGGKLVFIKEFMTEILTGIRRRKLASSAIPQEFPLLRTLQFAENYWPIQDF